VEARLKAQGVECVGDEIELYLDLRRAGVALGDMYEAVRDLETALHQWVRQVLMEHFPEGESWWWSGVPMNVRKDCASRQQEDADGQFLHVFCYTTVINLSVILDKNWERFAYAFSGSRRSKKTVESDLHRFNRIRNQVMHPVKHPALSQDDFNFVHSLRALIPSTGRSELPQGSSDSSA
jgi:hypothetical protein